MVTARSGNRKYCPSGLLARVDMVLHLQMYCKNIILEKSNKDMFMVSQVLVEKKIIVGLPTITSFLESEGHLYI